MVNDVISAWEGPNSNEIIIFIGIKNKIVQWCEVVSCNGTPTLKNNIVNKVYEMNIFDGKNMAGVIKDCVYTKLPSVSNNSFFAPISFSWYITDMFLIIVACAIMYFLIDRYGEDITSFFEYSYVEDRPKGGYNNKGQWVQYK